MTTEELGANIRAVEAALDVLRTRWAQPTGNEVLKAGLMNKFDGDPEKTDVAALSKVLQPKLESGHAAVAAEAPCVFVDELYKIANLAKKQFSTLVTALVKDVGFTPDDTVMFNGEPLMLDPHTGLKAKRFSAAPMKGRDRANEKIEKEIKRSWVPRCHLLSISCNVFEI